MSFNTTPLKRNGSDLSVLERRATNDSYVINKKSTSLDENDVSPYIPQFTPHHRHESSGQLSDSDPDADLNALQSTHSLLSRDSGYIQDDDEDDDAIHGYNEGFYDSQTTPEKQGISYNSSYNYEPTTKRTNSTSLDFLPTRSLNQTTTTTHTSSQNLNVSQSQSQSQFPDEVEENDDTAYIEEPKLVDKIASTSQKVDYQDNLYESLNILNDVESIRNLKFFDEHYSQNLNELKKSQLKLIVDVVKINEHSFDEFYQVWNNFEDDEKDTIDTAAEGIQPKENKSGAVAGTTTPLGMGVNPSTINLDINSSKFFDDMGKRNDLILEDLDKIKQDIVTINRHTKILWDQI